MEYHNDSDDSDDSIDQQDLEIALYSQIHFDTSHHSVNTSLTNGDSVPPLHQPTSDFYSLGLEELAGESERTKSFLHTSEDESQSSKTRFKRNDNETKEFVSGVNESLPFFIDKSSNAQSCKEEKNNDSVSFTSSSKPDRDLFDFEQTKSSDKVRLDLVEQHGNFHCKDKKSSSIDTKVDRKVPVLKDTSGSESDNETGSKKRGGKKTSSLYVVTKSKPKPKAAQKEKKASDEVVKKNLKRRKDEADPKLNHGKKIVKQADFIRVSKQDGLKKKAVPVTKKEAAVKRRAPPVLLRRPVKVNVHYSQDSDTNTDYSDSEAGSVQSSPSKGKKTARVTASSKENTSRQVKVEERSFRTDQGTKATLPKESRRSQLDNLKVKISNDNSSSKDEEEDSSSDSSSSQDAFESSTESDASSSSEEDDSDEMEMVGDSTLHFNIAGGVDSLLKVPTIEAADDETKGKWCIDDKDRYNVASALSRYFCERKIQCRNCREEGHLSRDCPQPLKKRCLYCAEVGHSYQVCPQSVCHNCGTPGHRLKDCSLPRQNRYRECQRCWMRGHSHQMCPDRWRQYHLTTQKGKIVQPSDPWTNPLVFCYNCGAKGHLGFDCQRQRMNTFVDPNYPFIAEYDSKENTAVPSPVKKSDQKTKRKREKGKNRAESRSDSAHEPTPKKRKRSKKREAVESFEGDDDWRGRSPTAMFDQYGSHSSDKLDRPRAGRHGGKKRQGGSWSEGAPSPHTMSTPDHSESKDYHRRRSAENPPRRKVRSGELAFQPDHHPLSMRQSIPRHHGGRPYDNREDDGFERGTSWGGTSRHWQGGGSEIDHMDEHHHGAFSSLHGHHPSWASTNDRMMDSPDWSRFDPWGSVGHGHDGHMARGRRGFGGHGHAGYVDDEGPEGWRQPSREHHHRDSTPQGRKAWKGKKHGHPVDGQSPRKAEGGKRRGNHSSNTLSPVKSVKSRISLPHTEAPPFHKQRPKTSSSGSTAHTKVSHKARPHRQNASGFQAHNELFSHEAKPNWKRWNKPKKMQR